MLPKTIWVIEYADSEYDILINVICCLGYRQFVTRQFVTETIRDRTIRDRTIRDKTIRDNHNS